MCMDTAYELSRFARMSAVAAILVLVGASANAGHRVTNNDIRALYHARGIPGGFYRAAYPYWPYGPGLYGGYGYDSCWRLRLTPWGWQQVRICGSPLVSGTW